MKSNEWYTPAKYIEAAREVMGRIDLDPASCAEANLTVKATEYYDKATNGLMQPWSGCVWLNPPYGREAGKSNIGRWTGRLVAEYQAGTIEQGVLLSTCRTDTSWFSSLWDYPICFSDQRIAFYKPRRWRVERDSEAAHMHGTIFVYLGPHEDRFIDIFSRFGTVAWRVSVPKPTPIMLELF